MRRAWGRGKSLRWDERSGRFLAYWRPPHGRTERHLFESREAAEAWLESKGGAASAPALTPGQYAEAQAAFAALPPGMPLMAAVRALLREGARAAARPTTVGAAVRGFLEDRAPALRPRTVETYRATLRAFAAGLEGGGERRMLASVVRDDVEAAVRGLRAGARNKLLRHVSPLFSWGARRGMCAGNPAKEVERWREAEPPKGVLRPAELRRLLERLRAEAPRAVAGVALGAFAGLRPEEIHRLPADAIGAKWIRVDGATAKTADARTVEVRPALAAWLAACPPRAPFLTSRTRKQVRAAARAEGIAWPQDALRHSYATYAYEQSGDAAAVAASMGHGGTDVFFRHYRALAEPGEGAEWFGIVPGAAQEAPRSARTASGWQTCPPGRRAPSAASSRGGGGVRGGG